MKIKYIGPDTSQVTLGKEYTVYWVDCSDHGVTYGICSNDFEVMRFPIYVSADETVVTDNKPNPLWIVDIETQAPLTQAVGVRFAFSLTHPDFIGQNRLRDDGFFVERMTNGDEAAMAAWAKMKAAMDAAA